MILGMTDPNTLPIHDLIDYAPPQFWGEEFPLYWQMTRGERFTLTSLLRVLKPELSLEVGTYRGGSLQAISRYSGSVVSVDIDPSVEQNLQGHFSNVDFRTGDSVSLLPDIIAELNASDKKVGFVLIDGDHSENGVRRDVNTVLGLTPKRPICIVMHDSYHPPCRQGMRTAAWTDCPHVHYVELDFMTGVLIPGRDSTTAGMVGGFGVAMLLPEKRISDLQIFESQLAAFETVRKFAHKSGFVKNLSFARRVLRFGERMTLRMKASLRDCCGSGTAERRVTGAGN